MPKATAIVTALSVDAAGTHITVDIIDASDPSVVIETRTFTLDPSKSPSDIRSFLLRRLRSAYFKRNPPDDPPLQVGDRITLSL